MMEIPDDVMKMAIEAIHCDDDMHIIVARAIMAERERIAGIATQRVELARTLAPEAAAALFVALPDAIRGA